VGLAVDEQVETKVYINSSGKTVSYVVYDEADVSFATGTMTEVGTTGIYTCSWTPDAVGEWTVKIDCDAPVVHLGFIYSVGKGQEDDILNIQAQVNDVVIYVVAEDMGTTEGADDGTNPALTSEVSQANANEAAGVATPAWTEDINFEQDGTITVVSIFYGLRWQMKRTGGTTAYSKWQISGDGGSTWTDATDNLSETNTTYTDKARLFTGRHVSTIDAGANKLQIRLCAWTDGTTVETKVRSDSYLRVTYRKGT